MEKMSTWTPKVCNIVAFWAVFGGFWLLFYILLESRYILFGLNGNIMGAQKSKSKDACH